jgi:hypothetical protein
VRILKLQAVSEKKLETADGKGGMAVGADLTERVANDDLELHGGSYLAFGG